MRRIVVLLLLFIAGGAIVNVAVACGMSLKRLPTSSNDVTPNETRSIMAAQKVVEWHGPVDARRACAWGKSTTILNDRSFVAIRQSAGFPCINLVGEWGVQIVGQEDNGRLVINTRSHFAWVPSGSELCEELRRRYSTMGLRPWSMTCLPLKPLWPGFAINTIFYAAILWLLFYGPGKVRRFVRVRKGQCPTCGFIIAPGTCANGLCSECGATLPPPPGVVGRLVRSADS